MRRRPLRLWFFLVALGAATVSVGGPQPPASPPSRTFGPDTTRTGVFTGDGMTGLTCMPSTAPMKCSGYLAGDDGTQLDVTVTVPAGTAPQPLVVYLHGYGGSKRSDSSYDDRLAARGYVVLRYSARGFGDSWGQVNLADRDVELRDLRSLIGQVVDDPQNLGLNADGGAVAVLGVSYGGGQSWLAAIVPSFTTPGGKPVTIRTVVPIAPWTDLLYSLRPNGRPEDGVEPPGFYKLSFLEGLFLGGIRRSTTRPYPNYPDYLVAWNDYAVGTEPNNAPPIGAQMVDGIAGYRSIWWQQQFWNQVSANAGVRPQLPVFQVQGFTDDLFPVTEALRMLRTLKALDPDYPIASYFGDIGHPRAANKPAEIEYALQLIFAWLDFYLLDVGTPSPSCGGPAPQLRCDVLAAVTRPDAGFDSQNDVIRVDTFDQLATSIEQASLPGDAVLTFDPANLGGVFYDPFVFANCGPLVPAQCAPPPVSLPGDVAVFELGADQIRSGSFLIAGQPSVSLHAETAAYRVQLDVRLFDVKPDGTRDLVTRGTTTLDSGSPLVSLGKNKPTIPTYGNLWQVDAGDRLQVEITNVDSPYLSPSRIPSVTRIDHVKLEVPIR
jgi:pimeloyl-ACP methyl ester carboxylesterase